MSARTRRELLDDGVRRLAAAGVESPRRNAEWILCDVLSVSRASLYADISSPVGGEQAQRFERMLRRRMAREPLQYVLGHTDFVGLRLRVTPDVLIPRPETEELVEVALQLLHDATSPCVLDVGTGSGCIALAIKSVRPDAAVYGCDVSEEALEVARGNAAALEIEVEFMKVDVLRDSIPACVPRSIDLLISNPPYVTEEEEAELSEEVRRFEPHVALFAGNEPLVFYRRIAAHGRHLVRDGGWVVLETHADYGREVSNLFEKAGYRDVECQQDLAGRDRIVRARR
ncbi:MAG: peptide chain release factor N(5)-glutamine methyltransferase [Rhodothermales bacterium]